MRDETLPRSASCSDGKRRACQRGAIMVEFAVVVPALFLLTVGIIHFCNVWQVKGFLEATAMRTLSAASTSQEDLEHSAIASTVRRDAELKAIHLFEQWYRSGVQIDPESIQLRFPGEPGYYRDKDAFASGGDTSEDLKSLPMVLSMSAKVTPVFPFLPAATVSVRTSAFRELLQNRQLGTPMDCFKQTSVNPSDYAGVISACKCNPSDIDGKCEGRAVADHLGCKCYCPSDSDSDLAPVPGKPGHYYCECRNLPPNTRRDPSNPSILTCPSAAEAPCPAPEQVRDSARCCQCYCPDPGNPKQDSWEAPVKWEDGKLHCGCPPTDPNCCKIYTADGGKCTKPNAPVNAITIKNTCNCQCPEGTKEMNPVLLGSSGGGLIDGRTGCCPEGNLFVWDPTTKSARCTCDPDRCKNIPGTELIGCSCVARGKS